MQEESSPWMGTEAGQGGKRGCEGREGAGKVQGPQTQGLSRGPTRVRRAEGSREDA